MNDLLKTTMGLVAAGAVLPFGSLCAQKVAQQPNVLMLVVDDWGAHDLSLTGSKLYETHNIDRLAEQSTVFSQGYVAYPRSVPSRYSLITGRHCARPQAGAKSDDRKVDAGSYCIAMPFKAAGYQTFIIGKWHLSDGKTMPQDKGFDINIGAGKAGSTGTYFAPFNKPNATNPDKLIYGMEDAKPGEYLTDYMSRKTVDYLKSVSTSNKPFFAVCSFYAVHTPIEAKKEVSERYRAKVRKLGLGEDPMKKEEAGVAKTQQDHPVYAAMIESVDEGIGHMIQTLKETGQYDNTIIVLISDHGGLSNRGNNNRELATTNLPFKAGKGHLYEGGLRVPLLIHLPGQKKEVKSDVPVVSYDLLPTLADLCDAPVDPKAELDGVSLKPLLTGKEQKSLQERDLFWHKASQRPTSTGDYVSSAVRSGRYKLIDFYRQNRIELYDLQTDPGEIHNLAAKKPEIVKEMMAKINAWRTSAGVKMADSKTMNHNDGKLNPGDKASDPKAAKKAIRKAEKKVVRKAAKK